MNYNDDQLRALINIEERIKTAVRENNAEKVKYYYTAKEYMQTSKLIVRLIQLNNRNCIQLKVS